MSGTDHSVAVGEIWRDRDPRMWSGNRRVVVVCITDTHVYYRQVVGDGNAATGREFRSKRDRFPRAFDLINAERER